MLGKNVIKKSVCLMLEKVILYMWTLVLFFLQLFIVIFVVGAKKELVSSFPSAFIFNFYILLSYLVTLAIINVI